MLERVKLALRISHNYLDDDISETIEAARSEMVRAGVSEEKAADDDDSLVSLFIKTFCLYHYCNDEKIKDKYENAYTCQLDNIRKSSGYMEDNGNV